MWSSSRAEGESGSRHPHGSAALADFYFLILPVSLALEASLRSLEFLLVTAVLMVLGSGQLKRIFSNP